MRKKYLKIVLSVLLLLTTVFCLSACGNGSSSANDASGTSGALAWEYKKDSKTLTVSGAGAMNDFAASADVSWAAVRESAETIVLSEGITSVGSYAFYGFSALKKVTLPSTMKSVGKLAFGFCGSLENVILPDGLESIGESAFEACISLKSAYLPVSVGTIGPRAFALCTSLESALITGTPSELPESMFLLCKNLKKLTLNEQAKDMKIADNAFEGTSVNREMATYTASADGTAVMTIKFVYEDGSEARSPETKTLKYGETDTFTPAGMEGYTHAPLSISMVGNGVGAEYTVTYTKNPETEAVTGSENTEKPKDTAEKKPVNAGTVVSVVILAVVLIGIGVGAFLLLRSDKKQTAKGKNPGKTGTKNNKK